MSHRPRKRFGQNFLHDSAVINRIVQVIAPAPEDHIVEIGPGQGAITVELLKTGAGVDAVELDRDLLEPLRKKCSAYGTLNLHSADALKFDFRQLVSDDRKLRLVGNLPYNISTPILFHLLDQADVIADMHFMLQKEVVDRMAAVPGSKTCGRLSVMIQTKCEVASLFDIGPDAFDPPPKVDSSIVRLIPRSSTPFAIDDMDDYQAVVIKAFGQRRKTLRNNLKGLLDETAIVAAGIDPGRRAETLGLEAFAALSNAITRAGKPGT